MPSLSPRTREQPSTGGTCFRSLTIAFRRSIQKPAECSPLFPRQATAAIRGWHGPKGHSGSGITGIEKSIRSIPKQARLFAQLNPTASSPGSPGPMESSGMPHGRASKARYGGLIHEQEKFRRRSRCRLGCTSQDSSPMAAISSSVEEDRLARSEWSGDHIEAPKGATTLNVRQAPSRVSWTLLKLLWQCASFCRSSRHLISDDAHILRRRGV